MKKRAAGCLFSYRFIYMLYGEYQCVPSTSCAPCWCRRSAMRWMTGQRVPSLRLVHTPMWTASACSPSIRSSFSSMPSSQMPFPCSSQPLQRKKACRNSSSSPYCAKVRVRSLKAFKQAAPVQT